MPVLKLISVGSAIGVVIPEEMLAEMKVAAGDHLVAAKTPGGYLLTRVDSELGRQLESGREIMKEHRETLRALRSGS